jgi:plasmid maintenance system antidote protein VapI
LIAKNIDEYLIRKGIKQRWLAAQLGTPESTLSGYLNGTTALKADLFIRICETLGVSPEKFRDKSSGPDSSSKE